jgi:hypothetical protein
MIELYKDGDQMAILTDAKDEREFMDEMSELLDRAIRSNENETDWQFQLQRWLPQMVDVCCKYRGYKCNNVQERRVFVAGDTMLNGSDPLHVINRARERKRLIAMTDDKKDPITMDDLVEGAKLKAKKIRRAKPPSLKEIEDETREFDKAWEEHENDKLKNDKPDEVHTYEIKDKEGKLLANVPDKRKTTPRKKK